MFFWDGMVGAFRFRDCLSLFFEFVGEWDIVEEGPGIVEFVVPCFFELSHGRDEFMKFLVTDEGEERRIDARRVGTVGSIVLVGMSPEWFRWFAYGCIGRQWCRMHGRSLPYALIRDPAPNSRSCRHSPLRRLAVVSSAQGANTGR